MRIDEPRVTVDAGEVTVAAEVTVDTAGPPRPASLYFSFPRSLEPHVAARADALVAGLLPLAMHLGEPLEVRGELSLRLAQGLRDWQRIQHAWKPEMFAAVELRCDRLADRRSERATGAVGASFSGGVDSFHTLMEHRPGREAFAPFAITHALAIDGFDKDSDLAGGDFGALAALYRPVLAALGVELVTARTNLLQFVGPYVQKQSFAAFVAAPALALGRLFARFYVPSSYQFTRLGLFPDGSHPMLDHLVSTETTETIHDGGHLTRVEKTVALSSWEPTFDLLRVCFNATGVQPGRPAVANCCACEKCLRTMITLDVAGALGRYRCFPRPVDRAALRRADYRWHGSRVFAEEIVEYAASRGRADVVSDLRRALRRSRVRAGGAWRRFDRGLGRVIGASHALEQRSRVWSVLVGPPKRLIQRAGWGRGWLY